jgi:exodeoxyribonuclease VII small subunit
MAAKKQPETLPNFETALARVEQIAAQMEAGDLELERLVEVYEEGLRMVRFCTERLDAAEKRLHAVTRGADGKAAGLETVREPGKTPPSTSKKSSDTEGDSGDAETPTARLF